MTDADRMTTAIELASHSIYEADYVYGLLAYAKDNIRLVKACIDAAGAYGYMSSPSQWLIALHDLEARLVPPVSMAEARRIMESLTRRAAQPPALSSVRGAMLYLEARQ